MTNEERKVQDRIKDNLKQIIDSMEINPNDIPVLATALHCTPNDIMSMNETATYSKL